MSRHVAMKILITGTPGFIGANLALRLLERGDTVIGIDNYNKYYDPVIKEARLARRAKHPNYTFLEQGGPTLLRGSATTSRCKGHAVS